MIIMKLRISEEISEKTKYDLTEESSDGPFNLKIDDIESDPHLENSEPHPIPPSENRIRMIPFQYRRLDPDWDVPNNGAFKKWTEEQEVSIQTWDDVSGLFSDILAVRVIHERMVYSHKESFPNEPESARNVGASENRFTRIKRAFGEVKDLFRVFGSQPWSVRKVCPNRNV